MRQGEWCPEDIADLKRWCAEGMHMREISWRLKRSPWAVYRKKTDLKLTVTARSPYRKGAGKKQYRARVDVEKKWAQLLAGRTFS